MQRTLSIIKPDGIRRNLQGKIFAMMQEKSLKIIGQKMIHLTYEQAAAFYSIHKERPFFKDLCTFMSSYPVSVQVLEGFDAVKVYRDLMGATNPLHAADGTIRKTFSTSMDENTVHGSDSVENALIEIRAFFSDLEIFSI